MLYRTLHDWQVSPTAAIQIQKELSEKISLGPPVKNARFIAGADLSYNRFSNTAYSVFVVLDIRTLEIVEQVYAVSEMSFPYVPGLLSFREIPPLIEAWKLLKTDPDVVVLDGQGIAHPRGLGIASHMGLLIDKPTIGCAKSILVGKYETLAEKQGATQLLITPQGKMVGTVLRTKNSVQPVFISPGHRVDFESSTQIILSCVKGYRIPEPTRQAHIYANSVRRELSRKMAS